MLINLTDHVVRVLARTELNVPLPEQYIELPPSQNPCRVHKREKVYKGAIDVDGAFKAALQQTIFGEITNAPPAPEPGVYYIVSTIVARHPALRARNDLLIPASVVKGRDGAILACDALQRSPFAESDKDDDLA